MITAEAVTGLVDMAMRIAWFSCAITRGEGGHPYMTSALRGGGGLAQKKM